MKSTSVAADRLRVTLAGLLALLSTACCVAALVLIEVVGVSGNTVVFAEEYVLGTVWPVVGALIVRAKPGNVVGWLMLVPALIGPYLLAGIYAAHTGGAGLRGAACAWLATWGFAPYFFTLPVLPHFFPDGRPLSRRWGKVAAAVIAVALVTTVARMVSPVTTDLAPEVQNPLGVQGLSWLVHLTGVGAGGLFVLGVPLAVLSLALRMHRARGVERTQLQWLFLGGVVLAIGGVFAVTGMGLTIGLVGFPVGIGIAMLRHRLFDVELTLNRTVVYGLLTGSVVVVYVAIVYVAQVTAPGSHWGVAVVAGTALTAAAGRDRVQAWVDRTLFGHRHSAYAVVAHVGRRVAAASQPVDALQHLVDGLRESLRLPYAAFTGSSTDISVASGTPVHGSRVVAVHALGASVGELHVGLRSPRERWTVEQQRAIDEVAARAGTLAHAAGLVVDIAVSRERIVAAREEERRRLRADLHDGVAPALAGTALQLESLARRLDEAGQKPLAHRTLAVRDDLRATVGQLRALVHGLRPPVLDQRGLAGALRQLVVGHEAPRCLARIGALGQPHAAIEVAAYAIAAEAFSNALNHSVASRIAIEAERCEGELVVTVRDNGIGLPPRPRPGVGMVSMRERAAEVGGRLDVGPTEGGGTTVRATLPVEVA